MRLLIEPFTNLFRLERLSFGVWQGGWASFQNWKLYGSQIHSWQTPKTLQLNYMLNLPFHICCFQQNKNWTEAAWNFQQKFKRASLWLPGSVASAGHWANSGEGNPQPTVELSTFLSLLVGVFAELSGAGPRSLGRRCCCGARNSARTRALHRDDIWWGKVKLSQVHLISQGAERCDFLDSTLQ